FEQNTTRLLNILRYMIQQQGEVLNMIVKAPSFHLSGAVCTPLIEQPFSSLEELLAFDEKLDREASNTLKRTPASPLKPPKIPQGMSALMGRIAGVLSEVSTAKFHDRMIVLEDLLQCWMNDEKVHLVEEVHLVAEEHPLAPQEETGSDEGKTDRVNSAVACVPAQVPESSIDLSKAHTAVSAATDATHCTVANTDYLREKLACWNLDATGSKEEVINCLIADIVQLNDASVAFKDSEACTQFPNIVSLPPSFDAA
ncbi:hypothetical protein MTO96_044980, partial [Rhipicephalus appendiculatus]